eukprot:SAG31_NODE_2171_length_6265_cov_3.765326_4_plen_62_part_00
MVTLFSISALHLAIKVPYFSESGHKIEKVTPYLDSVHKPLLGIEVVVVVTMGRQRAVDINI